MSSKNDTINNLLHSIAQAKDVVHDDIHLHPANKSIINRSEGLKKLGLKLIQTNPNQVRKFFDQDKLEELKQSIKDNGLMQPITVTLLDNAMYLILGGERRFRCFCELYQEDNQNPQSPYQSIPANIITLEYQDVQREFVSVAYSIIENSVRDNVPEANVALAYNHLVQQIKSSAKVQKMLHISQSLLSKYINIANKIPNEILLKFGEMQMSRHALYLIATELNNFEINQHEQMLEQLIHAYKQQPMSANNIKKWFQLYSNQPKQQKQEKKVYQGQKKIGNIHLTWKEKGKSGVQMSLSGLSHEKRDEIIQAIHHALEHVQ